MITLIFVYHSVIRCIEKYRRTIWQQAYGKKSNSFMQNCESSNLIYTRDNYERIFQNDLITAKQSGVMVVPRIRYKYKPLIIETLSSLLHKSREISVRIKEKGYNEAYLLNVGIEVACNSKQTLYSVQSLTNLLSGMEISISSV